MDMQNMEQSYNSISRLNAAIDELIGIISRQKEEFAAAIAAERDQTAVQAAKVNQLNAELAEMNRKLQAADNHSETDALIQTLKNEVEVRNNRISGLQTEVQNLNTALTNRKTQIEELNTKNHDLSEQLTAAQAKIAEAEDSKAANSASVSELQSQLSAALNEKEQLALQYGNAEQKLQEMQQRIAQTGENIDGIVARLEKVLEENGTGNNSN